MSLDTSWATFNVTPSHPETGSHHPVIRNKETASECLFGGLLGRKVTFSWSSFSPTGCACGLAFSHCLGCLERRPVELGGQGILHNVDFKVPEINCSCSLGLGGVLAGGPVFSCLGIFPLNSQSIISSSWKK